MSHPKFNDSMMEKNRISIWKIQVEQALIGHVLRENLFFQYIRKRRENNTVGCTFFDDP
jgi:hypothetical protein